VIKGHGERTGLPSRDEVIAFIRAQTGEVGTREIARTFGLKNADRAALRSLLKELAEEGVLSRDRKKKVHLADSLPPVLAADIVARDGDGELIATPSDWNEAVGAAPKILLRSSRRAKAGTKAGLGDRVLLRIEHDDGETFGRIIRLLDRVRPRVLGVFRSLPNGGGRIAPVDKKQLGREIAIGPADNNGASDGDLVSVDLKQGRGYGLPSGRVKEKLGSLSSERAISMIAIHAHDIPHVFPQATMAEAETARPATLQGREDWRELPLVTIDPPDAKDHDDAVHAEADPSPDNRGGFIVTVAIADVAFYVLPDSALDREALKRGNSVYFPDRVVPMLPERISNDLCSLKPGEPRGALAVRMVIGRDGRKRSHTFHRLLMRSAAKLHYAQAQAAIDGRPDDATGTLIKPVIEPLYAAYEAVKRARDEREPLDLDLPERKILLKQDGTVDRVVTPERLEAHRLIEEFMILANVAAAETLEKHASKLIYRTHDEPSLEKVHSLREFLESLDMPFPKTGALRPAVFNRILAQVKGRDAEPIVNEIVLRSQSQAEYSAENYGHFGLNLKRYAHFTSPIRRYADLVVHRALIRTLNLGAGALPDSASFEVLSEVAATISAAERRAMKAERETVDRLIAHHLADRVGAEFHARISGVTRAGLFVRLTDTGADGLIPVRSLGSEYFDYDEDRHALIGMRSRVIYRLGDAIEARLVEAAPVAGALRFELVSHAQKSAVLPGSAKFSKTRRSARGAKQSRPGKSPGKNKSGRKSAGRSTRRATGAARGKKGKR